MFSSILCLMLYIVSNKDESLMLIMMVIMTAIITIMLFMA